MWSVLVIAFAQYAVGGIVVVVFFCLYTRATECPVSTTVCPYRRRLRSGGMGGGRGMARYGWGGNSRVWCMNEGVPCMSACVSCMRGTYAGGSRAGVSRLGPQICSMTGEVGASMLVVARLQRSADGGEHAFEGHVGGICW